MSQQNQQAPTITVAGRLVAGDVVRGKTEDADGRPLLIKNGPNAGQPRTEWYAGLAVPKNPSVPDWKMEPWGQTIMQVARQSFPNMFDAQGNLHPNMQFAFKVTDGDSQIPNTKNIKPCDREGWSGHWVIHFANGFAPKLYQMLQGDPSAIALQPGIEIKTGYYAEIFGSIVGNNATGNQCGVFINMSMVCLRGYGPEIQVGPSVEAAGFGQSAAPVGASATPVGGVGQSAAPTQQQSQVTNPPPVPNAQETIATPPVEPATDLVNPPPVPNVEPKFEYSGKVHTMAEWIAMPGWTESMVQQHCKPV